MNGRPKLGSAEGVVNDRFWVCPRTIAVRARMFVLSRPSQSKKTGGRRNGLGPLPRDPRHRRLRCSVCKSTIG